jgi:DNA-binding NarL/FixJ family response regulator
MDPITMFSPWHRDRRQQFFNRVFGHAMKSYSKVRSAALRQRNSRRKILIVDDHPMTRSGMAQLIEQQNDLVVVGEAGDADQALAAVRSRQPDLVLVDLSLPGRHGLELIKDIRTLHPKVLVLVVTMHDESIHAQRSLRAGARGFLMKTEGAEKLLLAIRQVLSGKIYVSDKESAKAIDVYSGKRRRGDDTPTSVLTDREFEVFQFIGQGLTTREMGSRLNLSPKTVETHRLHIRGKLGLNTGPELIQYAVRWTGAQELI